MATYFSLVPDDVWYLLMMNLDPKMMVKAWENCPDLRRCTERPAWKTNYRARWGDWRINDVGMYELAYGLVICRAEEGFKEFIQRRVRSGTAWINFLRHAYESADFAAIDWIMTHQPINWILLPDKKYQSDYLQRCVRRGMTPSRFARIYSSDDEISEALLSVYPNADYTELLLQEMERRGKYAVDKLRLGYRYDPQMLMVRAIGKTQYPRSYPEWVKMLLSLHTYDPYFLYALTVDLADQTLLPLLVTPAVVELAITSHDLRIIYLVASKKCPGDLASLRLPQHQTFVKQIQQIEAYHEQASTRHLTNWLLQ